LPGTANLSGVFTIGERLATVGPDDVPTREYARADLEGNGRDASNKRCA
jgi:hypothetical protein